MASWDERFREAFHRRDEQERSIRDEKARREAKRKQQEEDWRRQHERNIQAAQDLLGRVGARSLLERVKRDVWKVGEIKEVVEHGSPARVAMSLVYSYSATEWRSVPPVDWGKPTMYRGHGRWFFWMTISAVCGNPAYLMVAETVTFVEGGRYGSPPWGDRPNDVISLSHGDYSKAQRELEEFVSDRLERMILSKALPLDRAPWYVRLFHSAPGASAPAHHKPQEKPTPRPTVPSPPAKLTPPRVVPAASPIANTTVPSVGAGDSRTIPMSPSSLAVGKDRERPNQRKEKIHFDSYILVVLFPALVLVHVGVIVAVVNIVSIFPLTIPWRLGLLFVCIVTIASIGIGVITEWFADWLFDDGLWGLRAANLVEDQHPSQPLYNTVQYSYLVALVIGTFYALYVAAKIMFGLQ